MKLDLIERKDKRVGMLSSMAFALILFISLLYWFANAGLVMGIEEPEWKTVALIGPGGMDYGTDLMGRKDVNNFFAPSENPADRPPSPNSSSDPSPSPANNNNSSASTPAPTGTVTQSEESPIKANSGQQENADPKKPDPKATGTGSANNHQPTQNTTGGGSDDGETNQLGNHGDPRATVLNPNGLFAFGEGIGGTGGRMPLKTELSGYNVQLEEKIKFEITIDPSGDVIFVRAPFAIHQELVEIGKANIKKWKFSETDPNAGNLKTSVTISFRLK